MHQQCKQLHHQFCYVMIVLRQLQYQIHFSKVLSNRLLMLASIQTKSKRSRLHQILMQPLLQTKQIHLAEMPFSSVSFFYSTPLQTKEFHLLGKLGLHFIQLHLNLMQSVLQTSQLHPWENLGSTSRNFT
jgi:hypothetical protein